MVTYIIRRLIGALAMLFIVSAVTFSIFFVVPRLAGVTADDIANRYVGRAATAETVVAVAEKLGLHDPVVVQYGRWVKGIFVGAEYDYGTGVEFCPPPASATRSSPKQPVWPDLMDRLPVTLSLAAGRLGHLAGGRRLGRRAVGAAQRLGLRPGSDDHRLGGRLAAAVLHRSGGAVDPLVRPAGITAPGGAYVPLSEDPVQWAYSLILPWLTLAFLNAAAYARLTRAGMLDTTG